MKRPGQPLSLTHLYLESWRNFTRVEVDLERRVLLVGPNASGKSNLLDALRFLHDLVCVGGGFQEAVRKRGGVSRLRCLAARQQSHVVIAARIAGEDGIDWEYELRFSQENRHKPAICRERVTREGVDLLDRPDGQDREDPERLTQTYLEQVNVNREFREVAEFFASIRYLHLIPQLVREPDRSAGRRNDPFGGDLLEQIAETPENVQRGRLRRILLALRAVVPQLQDLQLWRDPSGAPRLRARYGHWRPYGAWQTEEQFSDGTLRLLGSLWAALDGAGPLLLEEPELSLHPEVVWHILPMLARIQRRLGRQLFVSTHSADLLRDDTIRLEELLLLIPGEEGTIVRPASACADAGALLEGGLSLADAAMPETAPEEVHQLDLFGAERHAES